MEKIELMAEFRAPLLALFQSLEWLEEKMPNPSSERRKEQLALVKKSLQDAQGGVQLELARRRSSGASCSSIAPISCRDATHAYNALAITLPTDLEEAQRLLDRLINACQLLQTGCAVPSDELEALRLFRRTHVQQHTLREWFA